MGRLIDIDVLFDYFGNDAIDETTRSNIEYFVSEKGTVEAIPKSDYESRLKTDMVAMLTELQLEIHELENPYPHDYDNLLPLAQHNAFYDAKSTIEDLVDEKINALNFLEAESEDQDGQINA